MPDPQVQAAVGELSALTDKRYAEALADCVMDPDPVEQAAFRSPELAPRSMVAARYLIDHVNTAIRREGESGRARRAEHFRDRVGMERRMLEAVAGSNGESAVNPRGRAMRRLAQAHPREFLALVREEQAADRDR